MRKGTEKRDSYGSFFDMDLDAYPHGWDAWVEIPEVNH
jgi:hypothetical protein